MGDLLKKTIDSEVLKMLARRVDYAPANAKDAAASARMLYADLELIGLTDADCQRVTEAMNSIALNIGKWPTAYMVRDHLPLKPSLAPPPKPRPPMPGIVSHRRRELGLDRKPNESVTEHAVRCRQWLRERKIKLLDKIQEQVDREAVEEREAIQQEAL